jgi:hypothetical protein
LTERGPNFPELFVLFVGDELILDVERLSSFDERAIGAVSAFSIGFNALFMRASNALRRGVAGAVCARVGLSGEAVHVGLHGVDALALWDLSFHIAIAAPGIIGFNEVYTSDAAGVLVKEFDIVLNAAT